MNRLGASNAGDAVFEEGDELFGVADWRETSVAGANDSEGFAGGEMRKSFFEGPGEMELGSFGSDTKDGFAQAEDAVGAASRAWATGSFESPVITTWIG